MYKNLRINNNVFGKKIDEIEIGITIATLTIDEDTEVKLVSDGYDEPYLEIIQFTDGFEDGSSDPFSEIPSNEEEAYDLLLNYYNE